MIVDLTKCGNLFHVERQDCLVTYWFDSLTGGPTDSQIVQVLYPNENTAVAMSKFNSSERV
jgi:hypothetical protein